MENIKQEYQDDELTLKDLILLVQEYIKLCLRNWWLIGIIAILLGGLYVFKESRKDTKYTAALSYTTSEGGGLGGLAGGLLGRLTGNKGGASIFKMQGMLQSRLILEKVLFRKVTINDKNDYLINHYGYIYDIFKEQKDPEKMLYPITSPNLTSKKEKKFLLLAHKFIVKKMLDQSLDEDTGIAQFKVTSLSEEFSYFLALGIYDELEKFYIDSEVGEQQKTLFKLEQRSDSIYQVIQNTTYKVARLQDADKGRYFAIDKLPEIKAQAELEFLQTVYIEVLKNLETIKFTVASSTPTVKAIDKPMLPIKPSPKSYLIQLIVGGFLGGLLTVVFIIGRKSFNDVMSDDE